jgi:hypothetical protein
MKSLKMIILSSVLFTSMAQADNYYVDSMMCSGPVVNAPDWMHDSYSNIVIKFTSFLSKRKDGSLVPSLRVGNDYAKLAKDLSKDPGGEVWFMPSLKVSGTRVTGNEGSYQLEITNRRGSTDTLVGKYGKGAYYYALKCKAQVIKWPTRISDQTGSR